MGADGLGTRRAQAMPFRHQPNRLKAQAMDRAGAEPGQRFLVFGRAVALVFGEGIARMARAEFGRDGAGWPQMLWVGGFKSS